MKILFILLAASWLTVHGCRAKEEKIEPKNQVKEKVKEIVTTPFTTYDAAKDSLKASENKTKSALEETDKELQR